MVTTQIKGSIVHYGVEKTHNIHDVTRPTASTQPGGDN